MNGAPNPFLQRPNTTQKGSLIFYPQSASIEGDVGVKGKLVVFCKFHLGLGLTESVPDKKGDRNPVWTQELSFRRETESDLVVNLYHKNVLMAPAYLCECRVNLTGVFMNRQVVVTPELTRKGNNVGSMKILLKWEPDQSSYRVVQPVQPAPVQPVHPIHPMQPMQSMQPQFIPPVYNPQMPFSHPPQVYHPQMMSSGPIMSNAHYVARPMGSYGGQNPQYVVVRPMQGQSLQSVISNLTQSQAMPHAYPVVPPKEEVKKKVIVEELADPDLPEDQKCVICLDRKKAGAFYKCGHSCCCQTCGMEFIGKACPICREPVLDFIKVFDA